MAKKYARGMTLAAKQRKYLVIGDVHGCYDELVALLGKYRENRHVVFVGDLVDKGPWPARCMELAALMRQCTVVKGNHEENHLRYYYHELNRASTGKKNPMKRGVEFKEVHGALAHSSLNLFAFMESMPDFVRLEKAGPWNAIDRCHRDVVVLHGGLLPGRAPEDMDAKKISRVRNIKDGRKFATLSEVEADPNLPFWTDFYVGEDLIIYGHVTSKTPKVDLLTVGLDTGCVHGNRLTGMLLPEMELVSVPARKTYQHHEDFS